MDTAQSPSARRTQQIGTAALAHLWDRLDLPPEEPHVLSNRGSLLLRAAAAGLVARVSTHTGWQRREPGWWLQNEVAVGKIAQVAGVPAALPAATVDPGPHEVDGLWVSLWEDLGDDDSRATPQETAQALAAWHAVLAGSGTGLPVMPMVGRGITEPLEYAARRGLLDPLTHAVLTREHQEALAGIEGRGTQQVLLHGDAHRGNLLRDSAGVWRWNDLEEACRGPIEWDLAVLGSTPTEELGRAALTAYCDITGTAVPSPEELAPWLRLRELQATAWLIGCAVTFPDRYAESARRAVEALVTDQRRRSDECDARA